MRFTNECFRYDHEINAYIPHSRLYEPARQDHIERARPNPFLSLSSLQALFFSDRRRHRLTPTLLKTTLPYYILIIQPPASKATPCTAGAPGQPAPCRCLATFRKQVLRACFRPRRTPSSKFSIVPRHHRLSLRWRRPSSSGDSETRSYFEARHNVLAQLGWFFF